MSVNFIPPNLFDFAEQHPLCCLISTGSEYWFCWVTSALVFILYSEWVLILLSHICSGGWSLQAVSFDFVPPNLLLLSNICFGVWTLQVVSVDFVPLNLFDFTKHLLWCLTSTGSECWFVPPKSVWFSWATSALVSDLYRQWVLILCYQLCSIFLSNIHFGVQSLQRVSVDFVSNLLDFSEQHLLWCPISTGSECWFCDTKSVSSCWVTSALVSDLCREWVLILPSNMINFAKWHLLWCLISTVCESWLCHQICLIFLSNICFGVWSLQFVSIDLVPPNLFDFAEPHLLWCPISTGSECWYGATNSVPFCWVTCPISTASER